MLTNDIDQRVRELEQSSVKHTLLIDNLFERMNQDADKNTWVTRMIITTIVSALVLPALILVLTIYFSNI